MKPGKTALSKPRRHWGNFLIKRTATSSTMFLHSHHKNNNIFLGYAHKAADSFNQIGYSIPKHQSGARNITIKDARVKRTKAELHCKEGFHTPSWGRQWTSHAYYVLFRLCFTEKL